MSDGTTDTPTPDTPRPDAQAPDPTAVKLAAAEAMLAELTTWKAEQIKASEEAKRASMTESQKLAADREALTAKEKALRDRARKDVLTKLGVLDKAHQWAPDVDPADPSGAKALEDWAKANPELVKAPVAQTFTYDAPPESSLGKLLRGAVKGQIISPKRAAELLSRSK